jgi:mannose-6-phosphate isomerase
MDPILKEKVWGGRRLARYGKDLPEGANVGESWEVADLASTAPSGGGGGEARSRIVNGALAGRTVHEALALWGGELVGEAWRDAGDFPLLVKLLDAREHLSIQVHPTEEYAVSHPGASVKTESWFVVEAEPGAELLIGLRPGVGRDDLLEALDTGSVTGLLQPVPAVPGECHHVPSGTIHAVGAGILVAEFQSPSDTTFRLYDWTAEYGRPPRPLHIAEALEAMTLQPPPPPRRLGAEGTSTPLVRTDYYVLWGARPHPEPLSWHAAAAAALMVASGSARVTAPTAGVPPLELDRGATAILPAATEVSIESPTSDSVVLIASLDAGERS